MRIPAAKRVVLIALAALACGPGSEVKSGREIYLAYGCAACHGENADGRGPSAALSSVKPRDLRDVANFRGAKTAEGIATIIAFGIAEGRTGMPGYPDIPKRERMAMAEYILSLEPPATRLWVRESHPMQTMGVAYIDDLRRGIIGATTPAARVVELHEMKTVDGVMTMSKVDRITAPPQEGAHLMLIDLARPLRDGDTIELTLTFDDGTNETITAPVQHEE
jgi:copper(I)-binding protein